MGGGVLQHCHSDQNNHDGSFRDDVKVEGGRGGKEITDNCQIQVSRNIRPQVEKDWGKVKVVYSWP